MKHTPTVEKDYYDANELEAKTGTPAATWRYWASIGQGPESVKIGRRRVWKRDSVRAWLESRD